MKRLIIIFLASIATVCAIAADHVSWSFRIEGADTETPSLVITADIESGYHLYAPENPEGGAMPLEFRIDTKGCTPVGKPKANKKYTKEYNQIFLQDEYFYTGQVSFTQKLKPSAEKINVTAEVNGQVCRENQCVPVFAQKSLTAVVKLPVENSTPDGEKESDAIAAMTDSLQSAEAPLMPAANLSGMQADRSWWDSVEAEIKVFEQSPSQQSRSLWYIFIAGFIGGLIALLTPCVWPMIPMTVSFFLKQTK